MLAPVMRRGTVPPLAHALLGALVAAAAGCIAGAGATDHDADTPDAGGVAAHIDAGVPSSATGAAILPTVDDLDACEVDRSDTRVTLARLLAELLDLSALAQLPRPAYASGFFSTHDPSSDTAEAGDPAWYANYDFLMLGADETRTLLDVRGPGVLTRIWSASPSGLLRVYIDGADAPAIEATFEDLLSGHVEPFTAPFAFVAAGGRNLYFPVPFANGCRVTLTGPTGRTYVHLSHRAYAEGTEVASYGPAELEASECIRETVAARLVLLAPDTDAVPDGEPLAFELDTRAPNAPAVVEASPGGSVLRQIRVWPASDDPARLRAVILSIAFDGRETVRVPLGDFFAAGVAASEVRALPVGVDPGRALTSRWPMPFELEARVGLEATGAGDLEALVEIVAEPLAWSDESLLFHAAWHAPETFPSEPFHDWNLVTIEGNGLYVGNALNVVNRSTGWWGEGDEKIYVDGEAFPSHFGTGTEDYYGYAWCSNETFSTAFVGQTTSATHKSFGHASLYRFHVLDPIPFEQSLRFDLEIRHWGDPVDVTYDAVSYWYARPGSRAMHPEAPPDAYRIPTLDVAPPADVPEGPYVCGGE